MYLQSSKRESVAFNVGFSPVSNSKKSLRRQQGFIQKQPQSSSQVSKLVSVFEKKDSSASVRGETPISSASALGETPVQSWRSWLKANNSAGRELGDSTGPWSHQVDRDNKMERKISKNLADSFSSFQTGSVGNVNKTGRDPEIVVDNSGGQPNEQTGFKTSSLRKQPLNREDSISRQAGSAKKRQRSASFKGLLCGVKKAKLDDTYEEANTGSYCEAPDVNDKENVAQSPFVRAQCIRQPVRRSLKGNFFIMNDSPGMTAPAKATSASHLPPKPTPVIKTVKSDSMVCSSILKKNDAVSNVSENIKQELEPPCKDLSNKFASPFRDLDSMFSVAASPAFVGSTPAKLPPSVGSTPAKLPPLEVPPTPDLTKQFNVLSIYNKESPVQGSPRLGKKPSKSMLPWKKKSSSSTSRFKGTPVKIKLTPSVPKEYKSCSNLGNKDPIHPATPVASAYKLVRYPIGMPGFSSTPAPSLQTPGLDLSVLEEKEKDIVTPSKHTPKKAVSKLISKFTPRRSKVRPQENVFDRRQVDFAEDPPADFTDQVDFNNEHF